jgi:hypothetical protein
MKNKKIRMMAIGFGVVFLILFVSGLFIYKPQCSIRDDPFSMHKVKVNIGEEYRSYQDTVLCVKKGLFSGEFKKVQVTPSIKIYLENRTAMSYEKYYPKLTGQVFLNDTLMGAVTDGVYESDKFYFPVCEWVTGNTTNELGFEDSYGDCGFTLRIKLREINVTCFQKISRVQYVNNYYIDLNKCEVTNNG